MFVSRQIKFQFNRESRLIASTWRTSRITRLEKREERKRKIPGSRLIHFSAEITDISFILFLLLLPPPLFFPFSFFFLSSPYETVDTKPSGTKVEARWRMDRSIDRSIHPPTSLDFRATWLRVNSFVRRRKEKERKRKKERRRKKKEKENKRDIGYLRRKVD